MNTQTQETQRNQRQVQRTPLHILHLKTKTKEKKLNKIESDIRGLSFIQRQNIRITADFYP